MKKPIINYNQLKTIFKKQPKYLYKRNFCRREDQIKLIYFYWASRNLFIKEVDGNVIKLKKSMITWDIYIKLDCAYNRFKYTQRFNLLNPHIIYLKKNIIFW